MASAEQLYNKVRIHLLANCLTDAYDVFCAPSKKLEDIFDKFWSETDIRDLLKLPSPHLDISKKDDEISLKFRNEGNRLYKEKKFDKALMAFNYAVISARHPEVPSPNADEDSKSKTEEEPSQTSSSLFESLCFAFANRSAVLFEMGAFDLSKADIDRAISYGYPKTKGMKLEERKGKCQLKIGQYEEAEKTFKDLLETLKDDKDSQAQTISSLEKLLQCCYLKEEAKDVATHVKEMYKNLFYRGPETPLFITKEIKDFDNRDFVFINDAVDIQHSLDKGRYLKASRNIEPGEVLIVERAYCSILKLNKNLRLYCCVCMRKCPVALPCSTCSLVVFCSEKCRTNDTLHHAECTILPTVITLNLDEEVTLVFRSLCSLNIEYIKTQLKEIQELDNESTKPFIYSKFQFQSLYHLEGNLQSRTAQCLQETAVYSVLLVQLLMKIPQFWPRDQTYDDADMRMLGALIMRWILSFECNIHGLKELLIKSNVKTISAATNDIGYGVYSAFSLMNHCCAPNALNSSWGDVKYLYSTATIPKGEEITDCYGERHSSHDIEKRQKDLLETYHFKCRCKACVENWPLFDDLPDKFSLKCLKCQQAMGANFKCENCEPQNDEAKSKKAKKNKNKQNTSTEIYDATDVQERLKNAWTEYDIAYKELDLYKTSNEYIKTIGKLLTLFEEYTFLPHKPYIEAQEALLRSFDLYGSHVFIDEK